MKFFFSLLFLAVGLFAKTDYSSMSTEELLAMIGYVPVKNERAFKKELMIRVESMSKKERKMVLKDIKNGEK